MTGSWTANYAGRAASVVKREMEHGDCVTTAMADHADRGESV